MLSFISGCLSLSISFPSLSQFHPPPLYLSFSPSFSLSLFNSLPLRVSLTQHHFLDIIPPPSRTLSSLSLFLFLPLLLSISLSLFLSHYLSSLSQSLSLSLFLSFAFSIFLPLLSLSLFHISIHLSFIQLFLLFPLSLSFSQSFFYLSHSLIYYSKKIGRHKINLPPN